MEDQATLDSAMAQKTQDLETERRNKKRDADGRCKIRWKLEMDVSSYLVFQTSFDMYVMNLEEFGPDFEKWNPLDRKDLKHPPLASRLGFYENRLPIGMGSFKSGHYLCMIGGEKLKEGLQLPKARKRSDLDTYEDDRDQGTSRDVFICRLCSSKKLLLEPTDTIPKLKAGKARPIVESIEGKIFVHHSMGLFHNGWDNPDPVFEVYIPSEGSWLEIVDVPYVTRSRGLLRVPTCNGVGHFVIGCKLFIPSNFGVLHCFNAVTMKWDDNSSSNLRRSVEKAGLGLPLFGRCVSGLGLEDNGCYAMVYLQDFGCFTSPRPYAYLIDHTGRVLCYQDLSKQLFNDFLPYVVPAVENCFLDLGSGNMCAILYGRDLPAIDVVLHICFLAFKTSPNHVDDLLVNPPSSPVNREFLDIEIFNKYFCKLTGIGTNMRPSLVNAFFL